MLIRQAVSNTRPIYLDKDSSPTTIYVNKNVIEKETSISGIPVIMYEYDQYVFPKDKYEQYLANKELVELEKKNVPDKQARINELLDYLAETDWYAIRYAETGVAIPQDIHNARQSARDEISLLRETSEAANNE